MRQKNTHKVHSLVLFHFFIGYFQVAFPKQGLLDIEIRFILENIQKQLHHHHRYMLISHLHKPGTLQELNHDFESANCTFSPSHILLSHSNRFNGVLKKRPQILLNSAQCVPRCDPGTKCNKFRAGHKHSFTTHKEQERKGDQNDRRRVKWCYCRSQSQEFYLSRNLTEFVLF